MILALALAALLHTAQLEIGGETLRVEIADTDKTRDRGLMGRKSLPDGEGMLFVFEKSAPLSFWMKNTLIPLSIGFFDSSKTLIRTLEMDPPPKGAASFISYESGAPAQYALEVPQHWFKKNRIKPGMKFTLHDQAQ